LRCRPRSETVCFQKKESGVPEGRSLRESRERPGKNKSNKKKQQKKQGPARQKRKGPPRGEGGGDMCKVPKPEGGWGACAETLVYDG